jgi:hypothetical protein
MNPNLYEGLVFNMPVEQIPIRLARETLRVGSMTLWQYQAFVHHDHPCMSSNDPEIVEMSLLGEWRAVLEDRFPTIPFVVAISPREHMAWYQATKGAPTEDEDEWKTYMAPVSFRGDKGMLKAVLGDVLKATKSEESLSDFREEYKRGFEAMTPRKGASGTCEICNVGTEFTEPEDSPVHRGVRVISCANCSGRLIHSTRTIREKVNPPAFKLA